MSAGASGWNWRRTTDRGMWKYGPQWLQPLSAAVPWVTVGLALLMIHFVSGTLTAAEGVLFDLPDSGLTEGAATPLVALVTPMKNETLVFFDDARYSLEDGASTAALGEQLADRALKVEQKTLLVLADRRTAAADLMKVASLARLSGLTRILFANRRTEVKAE
jgi:biopolymer transport protein ExbD